MPLMTEKMYTDTEEKIGCGGTMPLRMKCSKPGLRKEELP